MGKDVLIGVVTVTYNSAEVLPGFLCCMEKQSHGNYLLFAVDNASKDNSVALLHGATDSRIRVIANCDNLGVAAGNNQGIRAALEAGCSFVLLINNDTEFDSTLIEQLVDGLNAHGVDMVCPKMVYFDQPDYIWAAGGRFEPWLGCRSVHLGEGQLDTGQFDETRLVTYVPTCCVLIRKSVFDRIGLMDERYFVYVDDTDFMYRAGKAGLKLLYLSQAKLLHKVGRLTGGEASPFSVRFGTRNRLFFLLKHFGLLPTLPWLAFCYATWLLRAMLRKDGKQWLSIKHAAVREGLGMWAEQQRNTEIVGENRMSASPSGPGYANHR